MAKKTISRPNLAAGKTQSVIHDYDPNNPFDSPIMVVPARPTSGALLGSNNTVSDLNYPISSDYYQSYANPYSQKGYIGGIPVSRQTAQNISNANYAAALAQYTPGAKSTSTAQALQNLLGR